MTRIQVILAEHRWYLAIASLAVLVLLVAARDARFFHDEWMFIEQRSIYHPASLILPHNEHFVLLHALIYSALMAVFGMGSYLPYLITLFVAHVAFSGALYALVDRHVGRGPALVVATTLLFLGNGYFNLFWAFQMGFVGAAAFALWGLLYMRERPIRAALLMSVGVASQGTALFFVPAAALYGRSARAFLACLAPVLIYLAWYLVFARSVMNVRGASPTIIEGASYVLEGVSASVHALTGPGVVGLALLAGALLMVSRVRDRGAAAVGIAALLTQYTLLAISRQGFGSPASSHYIYLGAAFLLLVFASAWPSVPNWGRPGAALLGFVPFGYNVIALIYWSTEWSAYIETHGP